MNPERRIIVTDQNLDRLQRLLEHTPARDPEAFALLEAELARAEVVPAARVPRHVVTLNSRVLFEDEATGERRTAELVYPHQTGGDRSRISILAPVGAALLGLSEGEVIEFPMPRGTRRLKVVKVLYQPEAEVHPPSPAA